MKALLIETGGNMKLAQKDLTRFVCGLVKISFIYRPKRGKRKISRWDGEAKSFLINGSNLKTSFFILTEYNDDTFTVIGRLDSFTNTNLEGFEVIRRSNTALQIRRVAGREKILIRFNTPTSD